MEGGENCRGRGGLPWMEVHSLGGEDCNVKGGLSWEGWIAVGGEDCNVRGGGRDCDRRVSVCILAHEYGHQLTWVRGGHASTSN